jgi:hypothetical protein
MTRIRSARLASVLVLASMFVLAFSGFVLAQTERAEDDATVSTFAALPDRNLDLLDVTGEPLETVALRHNRATPVQVRVTDQSIDLLDGDAPFWVEATMNNLYLVDGEGHDFETSIPSDHITLGYATNALGARDLLTDINPRLVIGAVDGITCDDVAAALGVDTSSLLNLLDPDPICSLVSDVDLLDGRDSLTVAGVELESSVALTEALLDAVWSAVDGLPMALTAPGSGAFATPNCEDGIGAGDGTCSGRGTALTVLDGKPMSVAALRDLIITLLGDITALVGGEDAVALIDDVLTALQDAGGDAALLADALTEYPTVNDQIALIDGLLDTIDLAPNLELGDVLLGGQYRSLPTLKVDTGAATDGGQYAGTLTVTLFEGSID